MKEDKIAVKSSTAKENEPVLENGKKKVKEEKPATKVVVRRLPPSMTEEQFKLQVAPLPDFDYFYFVAADKSLTPNAFSRAYINFIDQTDLFIFTQKFDGYVFLDSKGGEFPAVVEFAPFQRIPKNRPNRKKDPKVGTIESDPLYSAFKERVETESLENKTTNTSKQHFFETSLIPEKKEMSNTPLLDFIKNRRAERQRIRDEKRDEKRKKDLERRKAKEEQRRTKKEDETSVVKSSPAPPVHPKSKRTDQIPNSKISNSSTKKGKEDTGLVICNKEKHEKQPDALSLANFMKEPEVNQKVRDLVNFFNKSMIEVNSKDSNQINEPIVPPQNCIRHKDVETEMIRNITKRKTETMEYPLKNPVKNWFAFNLPVSTFPYKKTFAMKPCYGSIPVVKPQDRVFVPRSFTPCVRGVKDIVIKPTQVTKEIEFGKSIKNSTKKEEEVNAKVAKKSPSDTIFAEDVFRKNLQKVVADVLGNSQVKSPKENIISKPKTFVRRVFVGSGEQCGRPGFYLPPRAFGCGSNETTNTTGKEDRSCEANCSAQPPRSQLPAFTRKALPPFSKKSVTSSKSDGDIEKIESDIKIGGSEESLKMKVGPLAFESKPQLVRRPYVGPRKSVILEKNSKVIL